MILLRHIRKRLEKNATREVKKMKVNVTNNASNVNVTVNQNDDGSFAILIVDKAKKKLSDLKPGDEFKLGDETFIVLEHTNDGTRVIAKEFAFSNISFGDCNDWKKSKIRTKYLGQDYYEKICKIVGKDNIIPMVRDLTSMDGLDDYGTCTDVVSLLTMAEYAKYHKILGVNIKYPDWWWLITPYSTPSNDYTRDVCCVSDDSSVDFDDCDGSSGVRPFLTLESSILVS